MLSSQDLISLLRIAVPTIRYWSRITVELVFNIWIKFSLNRKFTNGQQYWSRSHPSQASVPALCACNRQRLGYSYIEKLNTLCEHEYKFNYNFHNKLFKIGIKNCSSADNGRGEKVSSARWSRSGSGYNAIRVSFVNTDATGRNREPCLTTTQVRQQGFHRPGITDSRTMYILGLYTALEFQE